MPLSIEGQIETAHWMRADEKRFLEKYGVEKLQQRLDNEGVYAYGFSALNRRRAMDLLFELSEEYIWGDDESQTERYFGFRYRNQQNFSFMFWHSKICDSYEVVSIQKPFPREDYEKRMSLLEIPFRAVPVYRLAELTDDQIRTRFGGGVLWMSYCYIDLNETIKRSEV